MAYQITCDGYVLYDPRDEELVVLSPKCKVEVNTVGEGSFVILPTHPYYTKLKRLRSIFEITQDGQTIFRGRMTDDSKDFNNMLDVDLEGVLGYTNDTIIEPFTFPDNFTVGEGENAVEVFLGWVLSQHNAQAESWQKLKLGTVTVSDPNNYITRSSTSNMTTWECLKSKLFGSSLGGYLLVRYEADGNYVDYLSELTLTNTQHVTFGENMLDITSASDASETYSSILPLGAEVETDGVRSRIDLSSLEDGDISDDLVKSGKFIYSKSAVSNYGWRCVPPKDSQWDDVNQVSNLKTKAAEYLVGSAMKLSNTITVKAVDLGFTDDEIQSFRAGRNVIVDYPEHGIDGASYPLTKLDIDLLNPQNTTITIGDTTKSMSGINDQNYNDSIERIEHTAEVVEGVRGDVSTVKGQVITLETSIETTAKEIVLGALQDYSETGDLATLRQSVETQLRVMAEQITMNFNSTTESVEKVNGDLQSRFENLSKYIRFSVDGIEIGKDENSLKLMIDNDMIKFTQNGRTVGWWDGTDFHTGNIIVDVNERAQFGNFAFIPRSDGSLMFLKVGDE